MKTSPQLALRSGLALMALLAALPGSAAAVGVSVQHLVNPVPPGGRLFYTIQLENDGAVGGAATGCFNPPPECISIQTRNFVCVRAFNEGANCGVGNPPRAEPSFCVANPVGSCASGPNFGQPCTAPHGFPTDECPPGDEEPRGPGIHVTMPIPLGTVFADADSGGMSNGEVVSWDVPPLPPCGIAGTPRCPFLTVEFTVKETMPIGSTIEAEAVVSQGGLTATSRVEETRVGTFRLRAFTLTYGGPIRDRLLYRAFFTLGPGAEIHPADEPFRIRVDTASGPLLDLSLEPGELGEVRPGKFIKFQSRLGGLSRIVLTENAPSHFLLRLRARGMTLPLPLDRDAVVTMHFGDDVLVHPLHLLIKNDGRRWIGLEDFPDFSSTTTTSSTSSTSNPDSTSTTSTSTTTTLPGTAELCTNCIDDNGNGFIDMLDPACAPNPLAVTAAVIKRSRKIITTVKRLVLKGGIADVGALEDARNAGSGLTVALAFDEGSQLCLPIDRVKRSTRRQLVLKSTLGPRAVLRLKATKKDGLKVKYKVKGGLQLPAVPPTAMAFGIYGADQPYSGVTGLRTKRSKIVAISP